MNRWALLFAVCVGLLNIALNKSTQLTARSSKGEEWWTGLISWEAAGTFAVGVCSLVMLYTLYRQNAGLGQAVAIAGAVSIVGATLLSVIVWREPITQVEAALVVMIGLLLIYKFVTS